MEDPSSVTLLAYQGTSTVTLASVSDVAVNKTLSAQHVVGDRIPAIIAVALIVCLCFDLSLLQLVRRVAIRTQGAPTCDPARLAATQSLAWPGQADRADSGAHYKWSLKFDDREIEP